MEDVSRGEKHKELWAYIESIYGKIRPDVHDRIKEIVEQYADIKAAVIKSQLDGMIAARQRKKTEQKHRFHQCGGKGAGCEFCAKAAETKQKET